MAQAAAQRRVGVERGELAQSWPAVVKSTVCPRSTAWWAMFCAMVVLPSPEGPTSKALVAVSRKPSVISSAMAAWSHCSGQRQSKSASGLKRPMCAQRSPALE